MDKNQIIIEAKKEIAEENFRKAVEEEKDRIRNKIPLTHKLFPWKIKLVRR